jgi:hypothetical protein
MHEAKDALPSDFPKQKQQKRKRHPQQQQLTAAAPALRHRIAASKRVTQGPFSA